jgi:hypothetical protein
MLFGIRANTRHLHHYNVDAGSFSLQSTDESWYYSLKFTRSLAEIGQNSLKWVSWERNRRRLVATKDSPAGFGNVKVY